MITSGRRKSVDPVGASEMEDYFGKKKLVFQLVARPYWNRTLCLERQRKHLKDVTNVDASQTHFRRNTSTGNHWKGPTEIRGKSLILLGPLLETPR